MVIIAIVLTILLACIAIFSYYTIVAKSLPLKELAKIEIKGNLKGNIFNGTIYNGSTWNINEVVVKINIKNKEGRVLSSRAYKHYIQLNPLHVNTFKIALYDEHYIILSDRELAEIAGLSDKDRFANEKRECSITIEKAYGYQKILN